MFQRFYNLRDVVSVVIHISDTPQSNILLAWDDQHHVDDAGPTAVDGNSTQRAMAPFTLYHLPTEIVRNESWRSTALDLAAQLLGRPEPIALLKMYKIWVPLSTTLNYLHHVVYLVNVTHRQAKMLNRPKNYRFMTMEQLQEARGSSLLVSPEVISLMEMVISGNPSSFVSPADRELTGGHHELFDDREVITEILHNDIWPNEENMNKSHLEVLQSSDISKGEKVLIYQDYILTCFPYILLNPSLFVRNIMLMCPKWSAPEILQLFRAVDVTNRGYLTFIEYLTTFCICDINTRHSLLAGELRCRYIFRFFDRRNVGSWTVDEFRDFLVHVLKGRKEPIDGPAIDAELKIYSVALGFRHDVPLTQHNFMRSAGELRLRGTSVVLRFSKTLQEYMHIRGIDDQHFTTPQATLVQMLQNVTGRDEHSDNDDEQPYTLALHALRVSMPSNEVTVERLWKRPEVLAVEATLKQQSAASRRLSAEAFSSKTPANQVLSKLRSFMLSSSVKSSISWGETDMHEFGHSLISVCVAVKSIMQREARMLDVPSPVYVFGDLHGNIQDLMHYEKMFWPLTPAQSPANLLFLGDYVDRGQYGIEIIAYLFSYKTLSSQKVFLVRGNHEIRDIQKAFTFYKECLSKFGESLGSDVWTAVNNAFDMMPLAALIDGRIFCCHGGIAPPWMCSDLSQCSRIPVPLPLPDQQSELAWNLMWNDPVRPADLTAEVRDSLEVNAGFIANTQRGTGYRFSEKAFNTFLAANHLTHMIRAHELQSLGIQVQFDGKLLTVFSSSRYCGGSNDAAVIMVESKRIRVIRMNTKVAK